MCRFVVSAFPLAFVLFCFLLLCSSFHAVCCDQALVEDESDAVATAVDATIAAEEAAAALHTKIGAVLHQVADLATKPDTTRADVEQLREVVANEVRACGREGGPRREWDGVVGQERVPWWLGVWVCAGVRQGVRGGGGEGWGITERDRGLSELALSAMTPSFTPHTRTHPHPMPPGVDLQPCEPRLGRP